MFTPSPDHVWTRSWRTQLRVLHVKVTLGRTQWPGFGRAWADAWPTIRWGLFKARWQQRWRYQTRCRWVGHDHTTWDLWANRPRYTDTCQHCGTIEWPRRRFDAR